MAKKKTIVQRIPQTKQEMPDTVVFMTAYNVEIKRHIPRFWQRRNMRELLKQHHISGLSTGSMYASPDAKCSYSVEYDALKQVSEFHFEKNIGEIKKQYPEFVDEMMTTLSLHHSARALLDPSQIKVSMCFNMESFLVMFDTTILQVDPIAFMMNGSLIVNFELVDYASGVPLRYDAIYGRSNNYVIQPISKIKYFNDEEFEDDDRKIADIVFQNVYGLIGTAGEGRWEVDDISFVHNILVMSNSVENANEYFQNVLGVQIENYKVDNIGASDSFNYYSTEYLGLVTQITSESVTNILYDCIMLESFKAYLLLKMVIDYEVNHKLDKIIDSQIYVESLFYPAHVPIITLNMITNLKETISFSRYRQAIDFKVKALKIMQDRKRSSNGTMMNVLLYILAFLGSAQTLQVLQTEFGLPFKITFWVVISIFVLFGIVWICREIKKQ